MFQFIEEILIITLSSGGSLIAIFIRNESTMSG